MKKILQITPELNPGGGIENVIMNYYRAIDKNQYQFDFVTHNVTNKTFINEISLMGGDVNILPSFNMRNLPTIIRKYEYILNSKSYDAVHCNMANAAFLYLKVAQDHGIMKRILHSHQNKYADTTAHALRNVPLVQFGKQFANIRIACSEVAGNFLFGNKPFIVLPNAFDVRKFKFDEKERARIRKQERYQEEDIVLLNVGRLTPQKNQQFLLTLLSRLLSKNQRFQLNIVGSGYLLDQLQARSKELGIADHVNFLGTQGDMAPIYSSSDIFLFPSIYEGLGNALVEAQISGLPAITSLGVPKDGLIREDSTRIELSINQWEKILLQTPCNSNSIRAEAWGKALNTNFDITQTVKTLENIYS